MFYEVFVLRTLGTLSVSCELRGVQTVRNSVANRERITPLTACIFCLALSILMVLGGSANTDLEI